jgi:hypothetical protein
MGASVDELTIHVRHNVPRRIEGTLRTFSLTRLLRLVLLEQVA